jgi:hypothetical protein
VIAQGPAMQAGARPGAVLPHALRSFWQDPDDRRPVWR